MKPRAPKPNPHEVAGRNRKSARLVLAIEAYAEDRGQTIDETIAEIEQRWTGASWELITEVADVADVPSEDTIRQVFDLLRARARQGAA